MKRDGYKDRGTRLCNDKQMDLHPPLHDYCMNLDCIRCRKEFARKIGQQIGQQIVGQVRHLPLR
jgi:hypothetical protein